jgi:hypothetical protein
VLHPKSVAVYSIQAADGDGGGGGDDAAPAYYVLKKLYSHSMRSPTHSFVFGPFGGVQGADLLCVQSMNGDLQVFDGDTHAFTRRLPAKAFLCPGPLCYVANTDSFVTVSSHNVVECYKYSALSMSASGSDGDGAQHTGRRGADLNKDANNNGDNNGDDDGDDGNKQQTHRSVAVEWTCNIGEQAVSIVCARFTGQTTTTTTTTSSSSSLTVAAAAQRARMANGPHVGGGSALTMATVTAAHVISTPAESERSFNSASSSSSSSSAFEPFPSSSHHRAASASSSSAAAAASAAIDGPRPPRHQNSVDIIVVGERSLFVVTQQGTL